MLQATVRWRTIETLVERGVVTLPQNEETSFTDSADRDFLNLTKLAPPSNIGPALKLRLSLTHSPLAGTLTGTGHYFSEIGRLHPWKNKN